MNGIALRGPRETKVSLRTGRHALEQVNTALDLEELESLGKPAENASDPLRTSLGLSLSKRVSEASQKHKRTRMESLRSLTARFLAENVDAIPQKILAQYTWSQMKPVWDHIINGNFDSLAAYAKFATTYLQETIERKIVHISIDDLARILGKIVALTLRYVEEIQNPERPLPWMLQLDLSHISVPSEVLLQLGNIPGLSVLKVNDCGVHKNTYAHWSRSGAAGGFKSLALLDIRRNRISALELFSILPQLRELSSLQLVRCDKHEFLSVFLGNSVGSVLEVLEDRWKSICGTPRATIELRVHLGSHADRRPFVAASEDMLIDMTRLRTTHNESVAQEQALKRKQTKRAKRKKTASSGLDYLDF